MFILISAGKGGVKERREGGRVEKKRRELADALVSTILSPCINPYKCTMSLFFLLNHL